MRESVESLDAPHDRVEIHATPTHVRADPFKIERIVENLVTNALRHGGPGAAVWVRVVDGDLGATIVVEDSGPGVDPEEREQIFEPFRRGTGTDLVSGSGIGLLLVASFAELHGGRAWVEDRPGGGASFRVFIPRGDLPADAFANDPTADALADRAG